MAQTISPGAYVIRNRDSSAVLHAHSYRDGEQVSTSTRDEERHRDRQIWWIEADAGFEDPNNCGEKAKVGPFYRITNIAKDLSLAEHMHKVDGETPVIVFKTHGAPRQLWEFRRPTPYTDGEYYNIISALSNHALDVKCCTKQPITQSKKQVWELLKPVVSVPAGWLQIQNIHTRHLLSQTYPSWPLLAIPATATASAFSKHHESWATQWAFAHASAFGDHKAGIKTFVIKNRLTGAYMRHERSRILYRGGPDGSVNVWTATCYVVEEELWNLELDAESNWKIVHNCGFLLEQAGVSLLNGFEIVCATTTHDKRKSWAFFPLNISVQSFAGLISSPPVYNPAPMEK